MNLRRDRRGLSKTARISTGHHQWRRLAVFLRGKLLSITFLSAAICMPPQLVRARTGAACLPLLTKLGPSSSATLQNFLRTLIESYNLRELTDTNGEDPFKKMRNFNGVLTLNDSIVDFRSLITGSISQTAETSWGQFSYSSLSSNPNQLRLLLNLHREVSTRGFPGHSSQVEIQLDLKYLGRARPDSGITQHVFATPWKISGPMDMSQPPLAVLITENHSAKNDSLLGHKFLFIVFAQTGRLLFVAGNDGTTPNWVGPLPGLDGSY